MTVLLLKPIALRRTNFPFLPRTVYSMTRRTMRLVVMTTMTISSNAIWLDELSASTALCSTVVELDWLVSSRAPEVGWR